MPNKKKKIEQPTEDRKAEEEQQTRSCGHINKQYHNAQNELEDLACSLPKGHGGDHLAVVDGKSIAWSDAAGTPARRHA
jgi:hypothetical protein